MKITLAEWNAFFAAWNKIDTKREWYYEDQMLPNEDDDGEPLPEASVDLNAKFTLTGYLGWQGKGDPKSNAFLAEHSLEKAFKLWKKSSSFETRVIDIPKDRFEEVRAALEAVGIKIEPRSAE